MCACLFAMLSSATGATARDRTRTKNARNRLADSEFSVETRRGSCSAVELSFPPLPQIVRRASFVAKTRGQRPRIAKAGRRTGSSPPARPAEPPCQHVLLPRLHPQPHPDPAAAKNIISITICSFAGPTIHGHAEYWWLQLCAQPAAHDGPVHAAALCDGAQ